MICQVGPYHHAYLDAPHMLGDSDPSSNLLPCLRVAGDDTDQKLFGNSWGQRLNSQQPRQGIWSKCPKLTTTFPQCFTRQLD